MEFYARLIALFYVLTKIVCTAGHYKNHTLRLDSGCTTHYTATDIFVPKEGLIVNTTKNFHGDGKAFDCRFTVKSLPRKIGIFVVIQTMYLRQNASTNECIDFVQFRHTKRNQFEKIASPLGFSTPFLGERWGQNICGQLSRLKPSALINKADDGRNSSSKNEDVLSPTAFIAPEGSLDVRILMENRRLLENETLYIELAFTQYTTGCHSKKTHKICGQKMCIHKDFFEDNVVNCPFNNCIDEIICNLSTGIELETKFILDTRVMVTAATSIFLSFFLFLGCIWLCRYLELLCWTGGVGGGGSRGGESALGGGAAVELEPSAPGSPEYHDPLKDPPPAYETLFPHGAPPSVVLSSSDR